MTDEPDDRSDDAAYGRTTNTARYAVLHQAARAHLERLAALPGVVRTDGVPPSPEALRCGPGETTTLLEPPGGRLPVRITLTPFPGVLLEFGFRGDLMFPTCGCDGCDEHPDDEVARLADELDHLVRGRFTEVLTRRLGRSDRYLGELVRADDAGSRSTAGPVDHDDAPMPYGTFRWEPWSLPLPGA